MALYMPTNITPSTLGALGSGTVDAAKDMTVSWQVDGQNAMTAFKIEIYRNVAESTEIYSTGKKTDGCPFYGRDAKGNVVFFSYVITAAELASAGITNGGSYKLRITQWWTDEDSVTQQSASVFICRSAPVLSIAAFSKPVTTKEMEWTANYQQAQGDALAWVRWRLAPANDKENYLYDTGNIATALLKFGYDGLFAGQAYAIRCTAETSNGVISDTGWVEFAVEYGEAEYTGVVSTAVRRRLSGVQVSWPGAYDIPGTAEGEYTIDGGKLTLQLGSEVVWNTDGGKPLNLGSGLGFAWKGKIQSNRQKLFSVKTTIGTEDTEAAVYLAQDDDGYTDVSVQYYNGGVAGSSAILASLSALGGRDGISGCEATVFIMQTAVGVRLERQNGTGGSARRIPYAESIGMVTGIAVKSVELANSPSNSGETGTSECDYLWVVRGGFTVEECNGMLSSLGGFEPSFTGGTLFLADFRDGLQAGTVQIGELLQGWAVYRKESANGVLRKVAQVPIEETGFVDCSATSEGAYKYYVYGVRGDGEPTAPLISELVSPVLWDWTILACEQDGEAYRVTDVFRFSLNVDSGDIKNGSRPGVLENFTRYPLVQASPTNYQSGTLSGYLGEVGANGAYADTKEKRDRLFSLASTGEALFLKNRKGDLLRVAISGEVTAQTRDSTRQQALICSVPWCQIADASDAQIIVRAGDKLFDGNDTGALSGAAGWLQDFKEVESSFETILVTPDGGYEGIKRVQVNKMPYIKVKNTEGGVSAIIGKGAKAWETM